MAEPGAAALLQADQVALPQTTEPSLLQIEGLVVEFTTDDGVVRAVNGVSLAMNPGEIVGLVGESGCGKSVTAMSILGLIRHPGHIVEGSIQFRGRDLLRVPAAELRSIRGGEIAMIFQDPMTTLNPVMTVGAQIVEALRLHQKITKARARSRATELLTTLGVPGAEVRFGQYPHEFSGGMRQRAMIAMAIANDPALLIADEPTTALDVTIQAQVLEVLRTAQRGSGAATLLITHDIGVVAELADRLVVMYAGRVVEQADVGDIFREPRHPYTLGLLTSIPRVDVEDDELRPIPGAPPDMLAPPTGCAFHPRCPLARERCRVEQPRLEAVDGSHSTACHFHQELIGADGRQLFTATEATT
jgi:oligopeptide/dipeptide ABC transporter ATP-binding protein